MKQRPMIRLTVLLLLVLMSSSVAPAQEAPLRGFDEYVTKAMRDWEVPGLAVAVVKDDKIVLAKGYGVRKLGEPTPVDERTLFAIGSASKAFTTAALAMLVDEGKLSWDDPATKHLPGFQLFDPYVTRELTVRDLVCHRSGLERADLLWYGSAYDRQEILRRIRYLKPSWSFRSKFGYQNIMYLAAGQIVAAVTGRSWDDFIRERIFAPLGMSASNTSVTALSASNNVSTPHAKVDGKVQPIPWRNIDNVAPAGSINSNVVEMAQWLRLQLGEGMYQGRRLLSSGAIKEMHRPQMILDPEPQWLLFMRDAHFMTYGLGWFLHDYRGRKVVQHGGAIDGMSALVAMIPEEKLGVVVLINLSGAYLHSALVYRVFDAYLGAPARDWSTEVLSAFKALQEQQEAAQKKIEQARVMGTTPSLALPKYAGTYENEVYGQLKITEQNGKLLAQFSPAFIGELEHWHYDTFQAKWRNPLGSKTLVSFTLNEQAEASQVRLGLPGVSEMIFRRVAEKAPPAAAVAMSEAEMKKFAGVFALSAPPIEVIIEVIGGKLKATVPGQPVYTLVPVGPTRFQIEGAPAGFFVQYEMADGQPKSITIEQGAGPSLTLPRKP
ncbi:MAG: serine hydrolase [Acidobacteriota bacterium]|nr:serine hydrolase [Blastocatellia bacterium]MDW8240890.1 serine hydrolase [Acidobacteriota bacterium]